MNDFWLYFLIRWYCLSHCDKHPNFLMLHPKFLFLSHLVTWNWKLTPSSDKFLIKIKIHKGTHPLQRVENFDRSKLAVQLLSYYFWLQFDIKLHDSKNCKSQIFPKNLQKSRLLEKYFLDLKSYQVFMWFILFLNFELNFLLITKFGLEDNLHCFKY